MARSVRKKILYVILSLVILLAAVAGGLLLLLSHHYKRIIIQQMPIAMARATDSIYHVSFSDIDVSVINHTVRIKGLRLWPDKKQAAALRARHHRIPTTLFTLSVPLLEASGFSWGDIVTTKSLDCEHVVVHDMKWLLECTPHPEDSLFAKKAKNTSLLQCITAANVDFVNPDLTYHYVGKKRNFFFFINGGNVKLNKFLYNFDPEKDTSLLLYSHSGKLRFDKVVFLKESGRYTVKKPLVDFETSPNSVTLKDVLLKNMVDHDPQTNAEKAIYNILLPAVKIKGLNWHKLITNKQHDTEVDATAPQVAVKYFDKNATKGNRMGRYPHQLLLQVGLETNLEKVNISKGHIKYTEVTKKDEEAVIEFTNIHGSLSNVTNMKDVITRNKNCLIKLDGKFMNKSEVTSTFNFILSDTTGRFTMDGTVSNLDGDDVIKQAQALTFVSVTSFHLDKMDIHITGDEGYAKGDYTVLYKDLKISLFKFKSKYRKGKKGPFSFLGSTLILYPSNPMKDKDPRTVSTSFARDPEKGFIAILWKNIYRAAKKTAVRNEKILELTDDKESVKGEDPKKKGLFRRLFRKKN
ncbi:MAG: hypothetical protein JWQ38_1443 [Flavipsychrobacter sp.]|nr:hypothetical protein [Flavipsychrobacter sp.]